MRQVAAIVLACLSFIAGGKGLGWAETPPTAGSSAESPAAAAMPTTAEPPLVNADADLPLLPPAPVLPPGPLLPGPFLPPPACPLDGGPACPLPPPPPLDPPAPHVTVKVRVAACAPEGQELEYRICLENCSPAAAHHVILKNPLPENAKFVRANPEPTGLKPELHWKLGTMHGGERRTIVLVLAPTGTGDVKNCARVQFEHGQCVTTRIGARMPFEKDPGPKIEVIPSTKDGKISLLLIGPKQQYANLPAQYFLTVKNTGKVPATRVLLTAQVPEKMDYVSDNAKGLFMAGQVAWLLGDLQPGQSRTVELVLKAKAAGTYRIKAATIADPNLRDSAEFDTEFRGVSALAPELLDTSDPLVVGEETTYTMRVDNVGGAPLSNIQIKALIPDVMAFQRAKGAQFRLGEKTPDGFQAIIFDPVKSLEGGDKLEIEVTVRAMRAGETRFKMEVTADQLERGPVREEETTSIVNEDGPPRKL